VFKYGTTGAFFALASGIITFLVAAIVRRFQLDAWGYSAVIAIVAVIAIAALALRPGERVTDPTVALAASPQSPLVSSPAGFWPSPDGLDLLQAHTLRSCLSMATLTSSPPATWHRALRLRSP